MIQELTVEEFTKRIGLSERHISKLINGDTPLTHQIAQRLESVLGAPASFWDNLEAIYRENLEVVKRERNND